MKEVALTRKPDDTRQTLGSLACLPFKAKTLELPWRDNNNNVSCIPKNNEQAPFYVCKYTRSPRISNDSLQRWLKKNPSLTEADCPEEVKDIRTYEIFNVPGRAGVRIHAANYSRQLRGCIAVGSEEKDIDMDGMNDITHSGKTLESFEKFMNYEDFKLIIK